jgi:hypothetical protein
MPRPPKIKRGATPSILLVDDVDDYSEIRAEELHKYEPTADGWMRIARALSQDDAPAETLSELLARNQLVWNIDGKPLPASLEVRRYLQDYAYAVATVNKGPTPDQIAASCREVSARARALLDSLANADWWTRQELTRAGLDWGAVPYLAPALETLEANIARLHRPRGGRRGNDALRTLASHLAVAPMRLTGGKNQDWRGFVGVVLEAAGIKHPSPTKNPRAFDDLILPEARDVLLQGWQPPPPSRSVAEIIKDRKRRASTPKGKPSLGEDLLAAVTKSPRKGT